MHFKAIMVYGSLINLPQEFLELLFFEKFYLFLMESFACEVACEMKPCAEKILQRWSGWQQE